MKKNFDKLHDTTERVEASAVIPEQVLCGHVLYCNKYSDYFVTNKTYTEEEFKRRLPAFRFIAILTQLPTEMVEEV